MNIKVLICSIVVTCILLNMMHGLKSPKIQAGTCVCTLEGELMCNNATKNFCCCKGGKAICNNLGPGHCYCDGGLPTDYHCLYPPHPLAEECKCLHDSKAPECKKYWIDQHTMSKAGNKLATSTKCQKDRNCTERCPGPFCPLQDKGPHKGWFECYTS